MSVPEGWKIEKNGLGVEITEPGQYTHFVPGKACGLEAVLYNLCIDLIANAKPPHEDQDCIISRTIDGKGWLCTSRDGKSAARGFTAVDAINNFDNEWRITNG
jgi:hypothetical protein